MFSVNLYKGSPPDPETPEKIFRSRTEEDELCGKLVIFTIAYISILINSVINAFEIIISTPNTFQ